MYCSISRSLLVNAAAWLLNPATSSSGRKHVGRIARVAEQIANGLVVLEPREPPNRRIDHAEALGDAHH